METNVKVTVCRFHGMKFPGGRPAARPGTVESAENDVSASARTSGKRIVRTCSSIFYPSARIVFVLFFSSKPFISKHLLCTSQGVLGPVGGTLALPHRSFNRVQGFIFAFKNSVVWS